MLLARFPKTFSSLIFKVASSVAYRLNQLSEHWIDFFLPQLQERSFIFQVGSIRSFTSLSLSIYLSMQGTRVWKMARVQKRKDVERWTALNLVSNSSLSLSLSFGSFQYYGRRRFSSLFKSRGERRLICIGTLVLIRLRNSPFSRSVFFVCLWKRLCASNNEDRPLWKAKKKRKISWFKSTDYLVDYQWR